MTFIQKHSLSLLHASIKFSSILINLDNPQVGMYLTKNKRKLKMILWVVE